MPSFSPLYTFARCLDLEQRPYEDHRIGASPQTRKRVAKLYGHLPRTVENSNARNWPVYFDENDDLVASSLRTRMYCKVYYEIEVIAALNSHVIPAATFPIFTQFQKAPNGVIEFPAPSESPLDEQHCVQICGYDSDAGYFTFANSWGKSWGDEGFGYLPYGYLQDYCTDITMDVGMGEIPLREGLAAITTGARKYYRLITVFPAPFQRTFYLIEIFSDVGSNEVAWAICFGNEHLLEVEEFFVSPTHRRQGHARHLLESLEYLAASQRRTFRIHVPIIDCITLKQDIHDIAFKLGLVVSARALYRTGKTLVPY